MNFSLGSFSRFRRYLIGLSVILVAGCGGGGSSGLEPQASEDPGDDQTIQGPDFDVLAFSESETVMASVPAATANQPHISLQRTDSNDVSGINFEFDDGRQTKAVFNISTRRVQFLFLKLADGKQYVLEFSNYDDAAGTVDVTYRGDGLSGDTGPVTLSANTSAPVSAQNDSVEPAYKALSADYPATSDEPHYSLTGTWSVSAMHDDSHCEISLPNVQETTYQIRQERNLIEARAETGEVYRGIAGSSLVWEGESLIDSGLWTKSLDARILDAGQTLEGTLEWNVLQGEGEVACSGTSNFTASAIGGISMSEVSLASTDSLNQAIEDGLRTLSDPFETYLPLSIYKDIGETVADVGNSLVEMAESVQSRFTETRQLVSDAVDLGGDGIRNLGHGMQCYEFDAWDSCAREIGQRAKVLAEEVFRLDREDISAPFVATGAEENRFVQPVANPWEDLFTSGKLTTDELKKTNVSDDCAVSVLGSMNPDCPQFDDPLTWSEADEDPDSGGYIGSGSSLFTYDPDNYDYSTTTGDSPDYSGCSGEGAACPR